MFARATVHFSSLFIFSVLHFLWVGLASFSDAFGVFECPHLCWARKILNFDPCEIFMISKHDLLKRLYAFVHSHLTPTLVCSVGAQQTSFKICSTYLYVIGRMGENINIHVHYTKSIKFRCHRISLETHQNTKSIFKPYYLSIFEHIFESQQWYNH